MKTFPLSPGGAADNVTLIDDVITLTDLTPLPRFGLKGRGSAAWLQTQGRPLPQINQIANGVLRLGREDLVVVEAADDLRAKWHAAPSPKGYNAWREETWAWMHLSGQHLGDVLAKICPVDLSPAAFKDNQIAQTRVGYLEAIIWRHTHEGREGFSVFFDIAATAFFANAVTTAAREFSEG